MSTSYPNDYSVNGIRVSPEAVKNLVIFTILMFTLPFIVFFGTRNFLNENYDLEGVDIFAAIAAVCAVQLLLGLFSYIAWKDVDNEDQQIESIIALLNDDKPFETVENEKGVDKDRHLENVDKQEEEEEEKENKDEDEGERGVIHAKTNNHTDLDEQNAMKNVEKNGLRKRANIQSDISNHNKENFVVSNEDNNNMNESKHKSEELDCETIGKEKEL